MKPVALVALLVLAACVTPDVVPQETVRDLAPSGTLRAAINFGNPVLAQKNANGEAGGVSVDLARELARRLGVPLELRSYDAAGKVFADAKSGAWDIAFIARDPQRANEVEFTAPYVIIEGTYLVPEGSPLRTVQDVDRDGVRVAVGTWAERASDRRPLAAGLRVSCLERLRTEGLSSGAGA